MITYAGHRVHIIKKCLDCGKVVTIKEVEIRRQECKCGGVLDLVKIDILERIGHEDNRN